MLRKWLVVSFVGGCWLWLAPLHGTTAEKFEPYQVIIDREIFGKRVVAAPPVDATQVVEQKQMEQLARRLAMCAVNRTPSGNVAVGFIDNEAKPPRNIYLNVGEVADGYRIVAADYEAETATIEKELDGKPVTVTLKLGQGLIETPPPVVAAGRLLPRLAPPGGVRPLRPPALQQAALGQVVPPVGTTASRPPARLEMHTAPNASYRAGRQERDEQTRQKIAADERAAKEKFELLAREVAAAEVRRQLLAEQGLTEDDVAFDQAVTAANGEDDDTEFAADE